MRYIWRDLRKRTARPCALTPVGAVWKKLQHRGLGPDHEMAMVELGLTASTSEYPSCVLGVHSHPRWHTQSICLLTRSVLTTVKMHLSQIAYALRHSAATKRSWIHPADGAAVAAPLSVAQRRQHCKLVRL